MWVGCQSRQFLCLFWRETRQRILGPEISPYLKVGRGRERELTTRPGREAVGAGQQRGSWRGTRTRAVGVGQQRGEQRELAWNHRQGQSTPDSGDSRREDRVQRQWVKMSLHSSSFVEFSLVTHASVSPYMLSGMQSVAYLPLLLVNPKLCSCLFICPSIFSVPPIVFLCR